MTINDVASQIGKSPRFVMNMISRYGLTRTKLFSEGYLVLLQKLVGLSLCSVSQKQINLLLTREKGLLTLLKVDSLYEQLTWYEDLCVTPSGPTRLLMSGYDLGHPVHAESVQTAFDFTKRETELFSHYEMGADALRALKLYVETYESVLLYMQAEARVLAYSLRWIKQVARNGA